MLYVIGHIILLMEILERRLGDLRFFNYRPEIPIHPFFTLVKPTKGIEGVVCNSSFFDRPSYHMVYLCITRSEDLNRSYEGAKRMRSARREETAVYKLVFARPTSLDPS